MTDDIIALLDQRSIEQGLIRFARAMDDRNWAAFDDLVAEDATADMGSGPLHGRGEIVSLMRRYLDACGTTQHLLGNIIVDVEGDAATSRSYVHDSHLPRGAAEPVYYTLGDYHDRWERQDGRWWLVERVKHNRAAVGPLDVFDL